MRLLGALGSQSQSPSPSDTIRILAQKPQPCTAGEGIKWMQQQFRHQQLARKISDADIGMQQIVSQSWQLPKENMMQNNLEIRILKWDEWSIIIIIVCWLLKINKNVTGSCWNHKRCTCIYVKYFGYIGRYVQQFANYFSHLAFALLRTHCEFKAAYTKCNMKSTSLNTDGDSLPLGGWLKLSVGSRCCCCCWLLLARCSLFGWLAFYFQWQAAGFNLATPNYKFKSSVG